MNPPDRPSPPSSNGRSGRGSERPDPLGNVTVGNLLNFALSDAALPEQLGRYQIIEEIGSGGFGRVFLAEDELLKRRVAVKLLRRASLIADDSALSDDTGFLKEARMVAKMNHEGIVPIYDITETDEGDYCIVSRYIVGQTLRAHLTERRFTFIESAKVIAGICDALHHAHQLGVVHRDVKPANIMLPTDDQPMLLDFGLARSWNELTGAGVAAGTPGFMSPEQARGEDHLINGRSDIFSLGAVFYRMLTNMSAYPAKSLPEHLKILDSGSPPLPRQVDPAVPKELERICAKALAVHIRSRYLTATEMAEDLRLWLNAVSDAQTVPVRGASLSTVLPEVFKEVPPEVETKEPRIVPRGLRAFDGGDADFFLALIPGPRDQFGLPESLRFWKQRIDSYDSDLAFRVGVIYGPSGCGKSSLARAGLVPRCSNHVTVLYHESRDSGNVERLAKELHSKFPQLPSGISSPAGLIQSLRTGKRLRKGEKLLIVIDQFEQWLRSSEAEGSHEEQELTLALRQCDGVNIQALLLVRDDFWRGVSRLLANADVELDSCNSALVDLFEGRHAELVLESFGRAYGCLPLNPSTPLSPESQKFVQQSIRNLEVGGRTSPVRLALFADMFRNREWTVPSLRRVGGVGGVAVTFLEESFHGPSAKGPNRIHEAAARQVLQLLVPETGDVRGPGCQQSAMLEASGYSGHAKSFHELLRVLDTDMRLITPVDSTETGDGHASWQLTHDHMVPALRDWLLSRKAETLRGRTEISLSQRALEWHQRPEPSRLPRVWEWLRFRFLTKRWRWTEEEAEWMQAGMKKARLWGVGTLAVISAVGLIFYETRGMEHGQELARRVLTSPSDTVTTILDQGAPWKKWTLPELKIASQEPIESLSGLNARLALVASDPSFYSPLTSAMLDAEARSFGAIYDALRDLPGVHTESFHAVLNDENSKNGRKLRAFAALANFQRESPTLRKFEADAVHWLLTSVPEIDQWAVYLRPVKSRFSPLLENRLRASHNEKERQNASMALANLHADDPASLVSLLNDFPPSSVPLIVGLLKRHSRVAKHLEKIPPLPVRKNLGRKTKVLSATEEVAYIGNSNALLAAACLGMEELLWSALSRDSDRTRRSFLILHAAETGVPPEIIANQLFVEPDPGKRQALLLMLSGYGLSTLSAALQEVTVAWLLQHYSTDPDGGVHSSIDCLMKRWALGGELVELQASLPVTKLPRPGFDWWITESGMDMRIIKMADGRRFAITATEVPLADYERLQKKSPFTTAPEKTSIGKTPAISLSWVEAARYALWISKVEAIPADDLCYVLSEAGDYTPVKDVASRKGYRLPTREEWFAASNSSDVDRWGFGSSLSCATHFGWFASNAGDHPRATGALFPNEEGLWDTLGNASEWTHGWINSPKNPYSFLPGRDYTSIRSELADDVVPSVASTYSRIQAGMRLTRSLPEIEKH